MVRSGSASLVIVASSAVLIDARNLHCGRSICLTIIIVSGGVRVLILPPGSLSDFASGETKQGTLFPQFHAHAPHLSAVRLPCAARPHRTDDGISRVVIENRGSGGGHRFGVTPFRVRDSRQD